ncbi:MAG: peptide-binding protein [Acidobacteriota bacterium]
MTFNLHGSSSMPDKSRSRARYSGHFLLRCLSLLLLVLMIASLSGWSWSEKGTHVGEKFSVAEKSLGRAGMEGDTLVAALAADPQSLNFVSAGDVQSDIIARLVTESLVYHDRNLNIIPRLARSWDISEDRLTITFHLKDNARWHDGVPVTSEDVRFTFERIMDPASMAKDKIGMFKDVAEISAPDPHTFKVKYREPFSPALSTWSISIIPKHIYAGEPDFLKSKYNESPIGCGPFKLAKWERSQKIVLESNKDYWDVKPFLDRIIFKIIPSEKVRFEALLTGDIDYTNLPPLTFQKDTDRSEFKTRLRTLVYNPIYLWYISWNMDGSNRFFTDRRVRRAMTHAMDREGFLKNIYFGLGCVATTDFQPDTWANDETLKAHAYNPAKAKKLLEEAGWRDTNGNGIRDKDGQEFEFTMIFPAGPETSEQMAALFKESLDRLGVKMNLTKLEWSTFQERKRNHLFEAAMSGLRKDIDPDPYELYHSSQYLNGQNYGGYANPEADKLLLEGRREFDLEKRKEIYRRLQKILHEDQPYTYLFHPAACLAMDKRFRDIETSPKGIWQFYPGVIAWWVPAGEQKYK